MEDAVTGILLLRGRSRAPGRGPAGGRAGWGRGRPGEQEAERVGLRSPWGLLLSWQEGGRAPVVPIITPRQGELEEPPLREAPGPPCERRPLSSTTVSRILPPD